MLKLSVIIPVYNEDATLETLVQEVLASPYTFEIVMVDDGSSDSSYKVMQSLAAENPDKIKIYRHQKNSGKGAAIRTALGNVSGELVIIQDADLEYSPAEYGNLIKPFGDSRVMVVYGSRNLIKNPRSANSFYLGGIFLSKLTNLLYGSKITDESTCYKVFRTSLLKELKLETSGFDFCPEVTAKILKRKINIVEIPIKYSPRSKTEGKKIKWSDGAIAIWTLIKYKFKG